MFAPYRLAIVSLIAGSMLSGPAISAESKDKSAAKDPNEKVCENIKTVGSRLAVRRVCATRAEWEEKRRLDKMAIDDAQMHANDPCNTINTHSGGAAC